MFLSQYFSIFLSVSFHHHSITIHPPTTHTSSVFSCQYLSTIVPYSFIHLPPTLVQFSPVSTIPPLLHTHSFIYHPRCIMFFSQYFSFPCQYHSTIAPYPSIHLPPTLYNVSLPVLQCFPVSIIPPLLHNHSSTYHPHYFSFLLSVSFHHRSILIHPPTTHTTSVSPVSTIPPLLHTHSSIYHAHCIMFFSQYFSFFLLVASTTAPNPI